MSGREAEHTQIRVHKRKQSSLMNHLFEQDKMSPHRFLLYRKWNISNILTFLFNKISFSLVPGTAFHFRIHVSVTHMHPSQPKEHTVRKAEWRIVNTGLQISAVYKCVQNQAGQRWARTEPKAGLLPALCLQVSHQHREDADTRQCRP